MQNFNSKIGHVITKLKRPVNPVKAYNLWAENYESEEDNLIFRLEKQILEKLMNNVELKEKIILDYGCGTGRNWEKYFSFEPEKIIGCDVSGEMLNQLKNKYPQADTYIIKENKFPPVQTGSADFIFSTLVIAHIKNIKKLFGAWNSYLKSGGVIIISDLHPELLREGGKRTFMHEDKNIEIKNYVHSIEDIIRVCTDLNLQVEEILEDFITEDKQDFYIKKDALHIFEKFKNMPLIYGMRIHK